MTRYVDIYIAIKIFEEELGEDFIPLLVEPGISTRTTEFVPFAKEKIKILREANQAVSARLIRDEFKEHLGFVDVYRAIFVTAEAAAEIANKGMKAQIMMIPHQPVPLLPFSNPNRTKFNTTD